MAVVVSGVTVTNQSLKHVQSYTTGAQFRLPLDGRRGHRSLARLGEWASIGGGGGCGTGNSNNNSSSDSSILCGRQLDADALQGRDAASLSARLNGTLRWCRQAGYEVRIAGGGGGGGGTAECCAGFGLGYGFSFALVAPGRVVAAADTEVEADGGAGGGDLDDLTAAAAAAAAAPAEVRPSGDRRRRHHGHEEGNEEDQYRHHHDRHHDHHHDGGRRRQRGRRGLQEAGAVPRDAIEAQLRYDPLFRYLYNASQACPGGFQSWCCGA